MADNKPTTARQPINVISILVTISIALLLCFGVLWWRFVYSDPKNVFQAMLGNSMRLQSVTKTVGQASEGQEVRQVIQMQYGSENRIHANTILTQTGTTVETESVGTPTADYIRYVSIETDQKRADGSKLDFNNVINVWGKSAAESDNPQTAGELYNETVLGVVPLGVLKQSDRRELMQLIEQQNVYEVDYKQVQRTIQNGRPTYTYNATVDAEAYVKLLKSFGERQGLNHLGDLDPAQYAGQTRIPFAITVDVWSRQIKRIDYTSGGRSEEYSGHNGRYDISIPKDAITSEELQSRLQQLQ